MSGTVLKEEKDGVNIQVYVQPGAKKNEIAGFYGDFLKLKINAMAQDGKANKACIEFLAEMFGIAPSRVCILHGEKQRTKIIRISGVTFFEAKTKIGF